MEGVMVSNGREITVTDRNGNYQLDTEDNSYIFVIKPRGWATPVGEHNIPQFYTLISSEGAGADNFRGLNPAMPEDLNSVNFPLSPQEEPDDFRVLVFGRRLKQLRDKNGVSQEIVAKEIGISRARYSHYENNYVEPDIGLIIRIADYFGVDLDFLLGRSETPLEYKSVSRVNEIIKIIKDNEIEGDLFLNPKDWSILNQKDVEEILNHFDYITYRAKQREN